VDGLDLVGTQLLLVGTAALAVHARLRLIPALLTPERQVS